MKDREGEKEWREGMEGGRDCHTTTQIFHTHTHTLSLTIITAHMSLQKEMGSRGAYTHKARRILGQARAPVYVLSRYDVPVQHKLPKPGQGARRRYQLCLPLAVRVLEVPQLPLVDN